MNHLCTMPGCDNPRYRTRRICAKHRTRLSRHSDPDFTQWGTADALDVELIAEARRPSRGLTRLERILVARQLTAQDVAAAEIARIVGVEPRTVHRWRAKDRAA